MRKNLTEIVFILDMSGSMYSLVQDTIGGYNSMIGKQRNVNGDVVILHIAKLIGRVYGAKRPHSISEQPLYHLSV